MKHKLSLWGIVAGFAVLSLVFSPTAGKADDNKFMVLYVEVDSGAVVEVFESREVGKLGEKAEHVKPPFDIQGFINDKAIGTFFAKSSPG
jgi:hypothetical protein